MRCANLLFHFLPLVHVSFTASDDEAEIGANAMQTDIDGNVAPVSANKRGTIKFRNEKLVSALDRCKISDRSAVYILHAVAEALGHCTEDLVINRSSIRVCRKKMRMAESNRIKEEYCVIE